MLSLMRAALTFDSKAFLALKQSPDVFRRGFNLVLVVGLLVGLVSASVDLYQDLSVPPQPEATQQEMSQVEEGVAAALDYLPLDSGTRDMIRDYVRAGFEIGLDIAAIEPRLGSPAGEIFRSLGIFVSTPFRWFSLLFLYGVLVHFTARVFLRGKGSIQEMLGCTAMAVVPHLFDVLALIPYLGAVVGFTVFWWSYAVYVQGVSTAHDFDAGKSALAVLLPALVPAFLGLAALAVIMLGGNLWAWY